MLGDSTLFERQLKDFQEIENDPNRNVDEQEELTSRVECKGCGEMFDATGEEEYCSPECEERDTKESKTDEQEEVVEEARTKEDIEQEIKDIKKKMADFATDNPDFDDKVDKYDREVEKLEAELKDLEEKCKKVKEGDEEVKEQDESKVNEATVGCPNCGGELDVVSDDLRDEWERIDYYCPKCKRDFSRKIEFDQAGMTTSDEWDDEEGELVGETKTNEEEIGEGNKVDTVSNDPSFERAVEKFAQVESDENKNVAEDVPVEEDLFDEPEFPPSADAVGGLKRYVVTVHADDIVAIVLAEDEDAAVDKYLDDDIEEWLEPVSQPMFTAKLESEVAEKKVDEATRLPPQTVDRMEGLIDRSYMDDLRKVVQAVSTTLLEDGFEEEEVMIFLADQVEGGILGALDNSKGKASAGQPEGEEESVEVDPSVEYKDPGEYRESKTNEEEVKEPVESKEGVEEQKSTLMKASDAELKQAMTDLNKHQYLSSAVTTAMDAIADEIGRREQEKDEKEDD